MARAEPVVFQQFDGINNVAAEHRLSRKELRAAVNVHIDDTRAALLRGGHGAPIASTTAAHSLWTPFDGAPDVCLFRKGDTLYRFFADRSFIALKTGLVDGARMAYAAAGNRVFMSDGISRLWTDGEQVRIWGVKPPEAAPVAAAASGGATPKGKYMVSVTFLRADGHESGAPASSLVELAQVGGLAFSQIPVSTNPDVTHKAIYISKPNGHKLFRGPVIANATTSASYAGTTHDLTVELTTLGLREPPAGRVIEHANGRMLVADGKYLWYNPRPYEYELFSAHAVRAQVSNVNALAVMPDGVFVGLETKIDFHAGADFADAQVVPKAKYGASRGGVAYIEGARVLRGLTGRAALMLTAQGVCACGAGGAFQNVTQTRYQYTAPKNVAAVAREVDGFTQLVAVMR